MYKNRFFIWIAVLLIWFTITSMMRIDINGMLEKTNIINVEFRTDSIAKSALSSNAINGININAVEKDGDIIIARGIDEVKGYERIDDYIYSPIVCYFPNDFNRPTNMFYKVGGNSIFVNMPTIVDVVINEKTLGEAGITDEEEYKDNKIVFNMPSKGSLYYDQALESLYISLNHNRVPTDEERKEIEPTISALLDKSVECNDISKKAFDVNKGDYNIFIGPEFCLRNSSGFSSINDKGYYTISYFEKSVILKYDIFINQNHEDVEKLKETVENGIIQNKYFVDNTVYRTTYSHNYQELWPLDSFISNQIEILQ